MTPSLWALWALLAVAQAEDPPGDEGDPPEDAPDSGEPDADAPDSGEQKADAPPEDVLAPHRLPFRTLVDRSIGSTSRPVRFNWRSSPIQLGLVGDHLFELNNFNSLRGGLQVRVPARSFIFEAGLSAVEVWDTPSSELLALTPYRQPGRPDRGELDLLFAFPLAEGIVTARPSFFPATQLVLHAFAGLRYTLYPAGFRELKPGQILTAIWTPALTEAELSNLEDKRLDAMEVDPARYGLMLGLGNDLYFKQGLYLSPRLLLAVPVLAPASGSKLLWWADLSLAAGVAF